MTLLQVALGGAIGSVLRFAVGLAMLRAPGPGIPLPILTVNVVGSFLMGIALILLAERGMPSWQPFVMTGILGGFTTFSAFSLETVAMIERGQLALAALYVLLSVGLSVGALLAGVTLARGIAA